MIYYFLYFIIAIVMIVIVLIIRINFFLLMLLLVVIFILYFLFRGDVESLLSLLSGRGTGSIVASAANQRVLNEWLAVLKEFASNSAGLNKRISVHRLAKKAKVEVVYSGLLSKTARKKMGQ